MKKSELRQIIREEVQNALKAYGQDIKKLTPGSDEDIWLDDITGELSGEVVTKREYLARMLKKALDKKNWSDVGQAKLYSSIKLKDEKVTDMLQNAIDDKNWSKVGHTKLYLEFNL